MEKGGPESLVEPLNLQLTEKSKASTAESGFSCTDCKIP